MTALLSQLLLLKLLVFSLAGAQVSSTVPPDADDPYEYYLPENNSDITTPELKNLVRPNGDQWWVTFSFNLFLLFSFELIGGHRVPLGTFWGTLDPATLHKVFGGTLHPWEQKKKKMRVFWEKEKFKGNNKKRKVKTLEIGLQEAVETIGSCKKVDAASENLKAAAYQLKGDATD